MIWRTFIVGLLALAGCDNAVGGTGHVDAGPDLGPAPEIAATPEFDPSEGTFAKVPVVTIRTATPGATIHYTMNGSTPDATSPIYTLPLGLARTTTLKAIARRPGSRDSEVRSATYDIDIARGDTAAVQFEPNTGRYPNDVHVTLSSATAGAAICYTVDGSRPTCTIDPACTGGSLTYETPVVITATETRVRAIACDRDTGRSYDAAAVYTLRAATPTMAPPTEQYDPLHPVPITIASTTEGAEIHYTLDGTWPTCDSPQTIPSGGKLPLLTADTRVWAIACKAGYEPSETFDAKYLGTTCVGYLYADTQAELNALSRCKEIAGSLSISGETITDMTPLAGLQSISGALHFSGTKVEEWIAPSTLTSVRWLSISNASHLRHVGGFSGVTEFGGGISLLSNPELATFDAFPRLTTIAGDLTISNHEKLTRLEWPNLQSVGELLLSDMPALTSLDGLRGVTRTRKLGLGGALGFSNLKGLERLTAIDEVLSVRNATGLVSLVGLDNVTSVGAINVYRSQLGSLRGLENVETLVRELNLEQNGALTEIGSLNALGSTLGTLNIGGNPKLSHLNGLHGIRSAGEIILFENETLAKLDGLDALEHVTHDLYIRLNALGALDDLHALTKIDGSLYIDSEPSLTGLSGLGALQTIGRGLLVSQNPALLRVDGLAQLTKLGSNLRITKNAVLPPCQPEGLAKKLVELGYTGTITLRDNTGTGTCN